MAGLLVTGVPGVGSGEVLATRDTGRSTVEGTSLDILFFCFFLLNLLLRYVVVSSPVHEGVHGGIGIIQRKMSRSQTTLAPAMLPYLLDKLPKIR